MNEEVDVVLISSDEDDDYERNLNHQDDVVIISDDDDNGNQLEVEKAVTAVGFANCVDKVDCLHQGSNDLPELSLDECKLYLSKYGMRLTGTKEECMQRIREHVRLINGEGVSLYPHSSFSINCTGDACKGDVVMFKQNIHDSQRKIVARTVAGRIVEECYGESNRRHIFAIEVLWSEPIKFLNPLSILVLKSHKLYKFRTFRQPWTSESERSKVSREKHVRGNAARQKRKLRQTESASCKIKGEKRQKVSHRGSFKSKQPTQIGKYNPKRKGTDSVEKSTSTHAARQKRKLRQSESASRNNKGEKCQKVSQRGSFQSKQPTQIGKYNPKRRGADSVEKSTSTRAARQNRKLRQSESASRNNKGEKRQKFSHRGLFQSKQLTQIDKHNPKRKGADFVEENTSTHERKAVTVRFQKEKLKRLKDGRVKSLYPRSSFSINCTGDACKGDIVLFKLKQSIKRGERVGRILTLAGRIVKESYGALRQQHTFTVEMLWSKHSMNPPPVSIMLVRGCNLYRFGTFRQAWKNEAERLEVLEEKHKRGKAARHQRRLRLAHIDSSTNDKGGKRQNPSRNKPPTRIVKLKFSKRWGATIHKRKSTQPTPDTKSNPSLSKQLSRTDKQKFSESQGSTLVKESQAAHKMEYNRSTQLTVHQDLNPNHSMYPNHNLQEASASFHCDPNLNSNHPNCSMLQDATSFFPCGTSLSYWSPGYGHYNNEQWRPNTSALYQPSGQYHYNYGQPAYYHHNIEQTASALSTVLSCIFVLSLGGAI